MNTRVLLLALCVTLVAGLLLSADPPLLAQGKKGNNEEAQLRQQIQRLQNEVRQLQQQIKNTSSQNKQLQNEAKQDDKELDKLRQSVKDLDKLKQSAKDLDAIRQAKYVHTLILKLKKGADTKEAKSVLDSAPKLLGKLPGVRAVWVGKPAGASGDSVQSDYQVGLTILFDNTDAYYRFQKDDSQKKFTDNLDKSFTQKIYDFQPETK